MNVHACNVLIKAISTRKTDYFPYEYCLHVTKSSCVVTMTWYELRYGLIEWSDVWIVIISSPGDIHMFNIPKKMPIIESMIKSIQQNIYWAPITMLQHFSTCLDLSNKINIPDLTVLTFSMGEYTIYY